MRPGRSPAEELLELPNRLVYLIGGCFAIYIYMRNTVAGAVDRNKSSSLGRVQDPGLLEGLVVIRRLRLLERWTHQSIEHGAGLNYGVELADPHDEGKERRVALMSLWDWGVKSLPPIRFVKVRRKHAHPVAKARHLFLEVFESDSHLVE